jgi:hypothetical protein
MKFLNTLFSLLVSILLPGYCLSQSRQCIAAYDTTFVVGSGLQRLPQLQRPANQHLSQDSSFSILGRWAWGSCNAARIDSDYIFFGNGSLIQVLRISEVDTPRVVGEVLTDGPVNRIEIEGHYAFVLAGSLNVIDISDPLAPEVVATMSGGTALAVGGGYAYVGDFSGVVTIIDISDPADPKAVGIAITTGDIVLSIAVKGNYLYASSYDGQMIDVVDVTDKAFPAYVGSYGSRGGAHALTIEGNFLYLADWGGDQSFQIFDVTLGGVPKFVSGLNMLGYILSIAIRDSLAYLARGARGMSIVNINDKASPKELTEIQCQVPFSGPIDLIVDSSRVYIPSVVGLWTVKIEPVSSPASVSFFNTSSTISRFAVDSSGHAYLATLSTGLQVIDIANPQNPTLIGSCAVPTEAVDVAYENHKVFLLTRQDFRVVDVSNPRNPLLISLVTFDDTLNDNNGYGVIGSLAVHGSSAVVSRSSNRLYAIDISLPGKSQVSAVVSVPATPIDVALSGAYVYVAEGGRGIEIYKLIGSSSLALTDTILGIDPRGLHTNGRSLLVVEYGLTVYDLADPAHPLRKGNVLPEAGGMVTADVASAGPYVYLAYNVHFVMADVSNPDSPEIVYSVDNYLGVLAVCAYESAILLSYEDNGFVILKNMLITSSLPGLWTRSDNFISVSQNYPNPFNASTTIRYGLPIRSHVTLTVFNTLGQQVAVLQNGEREAGYHEVKFDGRNLASGVYLYRLQAGSFVQTRKLLLLK